MVLTAYGRAGEVIGLRLDDLDGRGDIACALPEAGTSHHYPLSRGVAQTILRYIRDVRPPRPERALFLTLSAPIRPMSPGAIGHVVSSRLDRLGSGKRRTPHSLRQRHSICSTRLSMKEVGDYLGHRSVSSTGRRQSLSVLREVAGDRAEVLG